MSRPRLLDLFCGVGGAAMGYHRAGFEVVGVDIAPQPHYPFRFVQGDALMPPVRLEAFDVIHASPPCQGYSPMTNRWGSSKERLIPAVRGLLEAAGLPFIIENVDGAPLQDARRLCGKAFGLETRRHRNFESNVALWSTPHGKHTDTDIPVYGLPDGRRLYTRADGSELRAWASIEEGQRALGIKWTSDWVELKEAIPPAYTEFIGEQLLAHLRRAA